MEHARSAGHFLEKIMARCLWMVALCFTLAAPASGQAPGDEDSGGSRSRQDRSRSRADEDRDRGDDSAGDDPAMREGRDGESRRGGPDDRGRSFRRSNPMFEALDADGDEVITVAELKKAAAALKKLDADGDGKITLAEAAPQGGPGGPGGMFGNPEEMVSRMFEENDKDGDGKLSKDEIPERMGPMLQSADQDGDGAISKEELSSSMEQMRNRFRGGGGNFGPGGGFNPQQMVQQMAQYDRNRDGKLTADEVPEQMRGMLQGGDANGDGGIDTAELQQIAERMSQRTGRGGPDAGPGDRGDRRGRGGDAEGEDGGDEDRPRRPRRPQSDE